MLVGCTVVLIMLLRVALYGSWLPFLAGIFLLVIVFLVVRARHAPYLAFAALAPFAITLPMLSKFPVMGLVLAIGALGVVARRATQGQASVRTIRSWDTLCVVFYLGLFVVYLMHPALPGAAIGMSQDITGFRSWLDHAMGLGLLLFMGSLISTHDEVRTFFRWMWVWAFIFTIVFIPMMFIQNWPLTLLLHRAGVYVSYFGNGWRRFVFLPTMGSIMIMAALLPNLFGVSRFQRRLLAPLGLLAFVAGGNRSSAIGLVIQLAVIALRKGKHLALAVLCIAIAITALAANALFDTGARSIETPVVRIMTTFSPQLARSSGSLGTLEWRVIRWKRAMTDIRRHPWAGMGYGGLKDYFELLSATGGVSTELAIDRDLATGSTHNGYISAARALGIPITVLFIWIMFHRIGRHWRLAGSIQPHNKKLAEAHLFLCSYLAMTACILLVSAEIRSPALWLMLAMGFVIERITHTDDDVAVAT